ncbi:recombinase family protein [Bacillus velezensis]|uniref:recombinase family protein n=1 Tax=Bacillus velezensis TaxID=492670 RepID=UPI001C64F511|nr:recombinase family protein [Bacillus velezensis]MBW7976591.1 recombinase family protein [Bacillus velezensis]
MRLREYNINSIVNYLRKSRKDIERERRTGEDTLYQQQKTMTEFLDKTGIPYVQRFEVGSGDKISTRPVFQGVLEELKEFKYDAIAVKEISRLGRGSMSDMGVIYDLIIENRIFILTPDRTYDPRNDSDLRQIRFEMFFAREEFEQIRQRLTGARYSSAREGKWMGVVPYGYTRNPKTLRLEPNEDAKNVKLIFNLLAHGIDGKEVRERAIATYLKRIGIKSAKGLDQWDTTQLKRLLTNQAYIGVSKFRETERLSNGKLRKRPVDEHIIVENAHEPIISKELFDEVQKKLNNRTVTKVKLDVGRYALTGLVTCGVCGSRMVVNSYSRKRKDYVLRDSYLVCKNTCQSVKYDTVEREIINQLQGMKQMDIELLQEAKNEALKDTSIEEQYLLKEEIKKSILQKKENLQKRLKFIQQKHFNGIYTDEDYLGFKKEIDEELKEIEKIEQNDFEDEASAALEDAPLEKEQFVKQIDHILDAYQNTDSKEKKNQLLTEYYDEIVLTVLESGTRVKPAKIKLDSALSYNFWNIGS